MTEPHEPIQVCVEYSSADIAAASGNPELLTLAYYDATAGHWVVLETEVNTATGIACAWTSHLSDFAILAGAVGGGLVWWVWLLVVGISGLVIVLVVILIFRRLREY